MAKNPFEDQDGVIRVPEIYQEGFDLMVQDLLNKAADEIISERCAKENPEPINDDMLFLQMIRGEDY